MLLFSKPFDIIDEEDEETEEFEMPAHGLPVILSHDTSEDPKCDKKVFNLFTPYLFRLDFIIND